MDDREEYLVYTGLDEATKAIKILKAYRFLKKEHAILLNDNTVFCEADIDNLIDKTLKVLYDSQELRIPF